MTTLTDFEYYAAAAARLRETGTPVSPMFVEVEPVTPLAPTEWPLTARIMRRLRTAEDAGVGDTIHRQLGAPGRWFESAAESLGLNCGCADRKAWLNRRFPYHSDHER